MTVDEFDPYGVFRHVWGLISSGQPDDGETGRQVYCVRSAATGLVKIGYAKNVRTRVMALASQSGSEMILVGTLPGGPRQEKALHDRFSSQRKRGEWFEPSHEMLAVFAGDAPNI